jgi:hypothetical protein
VPELPHSRHTARRSHKSFVLNKLNNGGRVAQPLLLNFHWGNSSLFDCNVHGAPGFAQFLKKVNEIGSHPSWRVAHPLGLNFRVPEPFAREGSGFSFLDQRLIARMQSVSLLARIAPSSYASRPGRFAPRNAHLPRAANRRRSQTSCEPEDCHSGRACASNFSPSGG